MLENYKDAIHKIEIKPEKGFTDTMHVQTNVVNRMTDEEDNDQYFTIIGKHDFIDDNGNPQLKKDSTDNTFAKRVCKNKHILHFIKLDKNGYLYNPYGSYTHISDRIFIKKGDKEKEKFLKVRQPIFESYIKFLATRNKVWLNQAQRA